MTHNNVTGPSLNPTRSTINCRVLLGHAVLFDLLFMPYCQWVIMPISLPVVLLTLAVDGRLRLPKNHHLMLSALFACVGLSVGVSMFLPQSRPYLEENIKRLLQFITSFAYFVFFYNSAQRFGKKVFSIRLFYAFTVYFCALSILFFLNPTDIHALMMDVYGRLVTSENVIKQHFRFSYMFTDPNTGCYFFLVAAMPLLYFARSTGGFVVTSLFLLLPVLISQSRGGLLALVLGALAWALPSHSILAQMPKKNLRKVAWLSTTVAIGICVMGRLVTSPFLEGEPLVELIISRLSDADAYAHGGSRPEIWGRYISQLIPLPLGRGHLFDVGVYRFHPHSDLLRLSYSYGLVAASICVYVCFRHTLRCSLLIFPALMAFGINSLLDEQKLFALFLSLLGMYYAGVFTNADEMCVPSKQLR